MKSKATWSRPTAFDFVPKTDLVTSRVYIDEIERVVPDVGHTHIMMKLFWGLGALILRR